MDYKKKYFRNCSNFHVGLISLNVRNLDISSRAHRICSGLNSAINNKSNRCFILNKTQICN